MSKSSFSDKLIREICISRLMIKILAGIGFLLSGYALYVKMRIERNPSFRPACDVSDHISCTKAFGSAYGTTMGMPNPVYGLIFYSLVFLFFDSALYISTAGILASAYLAYISYVKQKNFCLVCSAIYLINILLFLISL